jgi:filamin
VTGNVKSGFLAEFLPEEVGPHVISVEYNNIPVGGTPFTGSSYKTSDEGLFQLT